MAKSVKPAAQNKYIANLTVTSLSRTILLMQNEVFPNRKVLKRQQWVPETQHDPRRRMIYSDLPVVQKDKQFKNKAHRGVTSAAAHETKCNEMCP